MHSLRYILAALFLAASPSFAQQALTDGTAAPGEPYALRGGITLTQSNSLNVAGGGVACADNTTGNTTENSYLRVFKLSDFPAVTGAITVGSVDIGLGANTATSPVNTDVILYSMQGGVSYSGGFARTTLTEVARATFVVQPGLASGVYSVPMPASATFAATDTLVVEWMTPNGTTGENLFNIRMGGNDAGQTGPTYLSTMTSCGGLAPTPVSALGSFSNSQWVLAVNAALATAAEAGPEGATIRLGDAVPNPSAAGTAIPFSLEAAMPARVAVYDVLGREVAVLVDGVQSAGSHTARLAPGQLSAGTYVVRLQTAQGTVAQTLTITR